MMENVKMSTFKFAGVSKHNDQLKFRATNRDGYADILIKEGKTNVDIRELPTPMDKDAAKSYLITLPEFQTQEILAVLKGESKASKASPKAAKPAKAAVTPATRVAKEVKVKVPADQTGAVVASTKTLEEIEAIKAHNLDIIRQVGAKRKAEQERAAEDELRRQELDVDITRMDDEDPRSYVPKFLHKELGLL